MNIKEVKGSFYRQKLVSPLWAVLVPFVSVSKGVFHIATRTSWRSPEVFYIISRSRFSLLSSNNLVLDHIFWGLTTIILNIVWRCASTFRKQDQIFCHCGCPISKVLVAFLRRIRFIADEVAVDIFQYLRSQPKPFVVVVFGLHEGIGLRFFSFWVPSWFIKVSTVYSAGGNNSVPCRSLLLRWTYMR